MKPVFVHDLLSHVNATLTTSFLVRSREVRFKKTGEPYLSVVLGDRTGEVEARMWENVEEAPPFDRDDFVKVKALVQVFRNKPQLSIHKLRRLEDSEVEIADFFPRSERDIEQMFSELRLVVAAVGNPHLRALLVAFLDDEAIAENLKIAPAAKTLHHAYIGGLLEHVLSLCALCRVIARHYRDLDLDLLVTGAVLHDIGKIRELDYRRSISYSTEGQLLGHILIALAMLQEKMRALPAFPETLRVLLEHIIASHHGELEFGSPKEPMFPEAVVLHYLDNLDSKVNAMAGQLRSDPLVDGEWTMKNPALGRALLKSGKYLAKAAAATAATAATAAAGNGTARESAESATIANPEESAPQEAPAPQPTLFGGNEGHDE